MGAQARGLPVNGGGYARGGPQGVADPLGDLTPDTGHHFAALAGAEDVKALVLLLESTDTGGNFPVGVEAVVVTSADTGSTNPTGSSSFVVVSGDGDIGGLIGHYVGARLGGAGDIATLDKFYIDDDYGLDGGVGSVTNAVDKIRGIFVESLENAKPNRVYAVSTRQTKTGAPVGKMYWAFAATGDSPSVFGGTVQVVMDHSLFSQSADPPLPVATNALECGTQASPRNAYITKSGDVVINDATKGVILKSPNGHYWRQTISNTGSVTWADLGTTAP